MKSLDQADFIYADYSASSPLLKEVSKYLEHRLHHGPMGNPNSLHAIGRNLMKGIKKCKESIGLILNADPDSIIVNSVASEGISQVVQSYFFKNKKEKLNKKILLTSAIEHQAIIEAFNFFATEGLELKIIGCSPRGIIDLSHLKQTIKQHEGEILLASFMAVNNETGIIQPYEEIGTILAEKKIPFLCDTTQLIGKMPFSFNNLPIDFAVCSGHKLGALGGTGLLLAKRREDLYPLIHGSGQELSVRSGTQNYLGLETLAVALEHHAQKFNQIELQKNSRFVFEKELCEHFPEIVIIGMNEERLPLVSLIAYPGIHSQAVQIELESQNVFVTTSAACSDNEPHTSHILRAMCVPDSIGRGVIRISLSSDQYEEKYNQLLPKIIKSIEKLKRIEFN